MLFSMPGTPVLYYGDEIGMGDDIYLRDRTGGHANAVERLPQCWFFRRRVLGSFAP